MTGSERIPKLYIRHFVKTDFIFATVMISSVLRSPVLMFHSLDTTCNYNQALETYDAGSLTEVHVRFETGRCLLGIASNNLPTDQLGVRMLMLFQDVHHLLHRCISPLTPGCRQTNTLRQLLQCPMQRFRGPMPPICHIMQKCFFICRGERENSF